MQLQPHVDEPVGMALYEMKGGQLSNIMMQGGATVIWKLCKPHYLDLETKSASFIVKTGCFTPLEDFPLDPNVSAYQGSGSAPR